jgi:hypothetical protein
VKKYLIPAIILVLTVSAVYIRHQILAPARAAERDLEALNGITVGKTTEAELLGHDAFQIAELNCFGDKCMYRTERENKLLGVLHLAVPTSLSTSVMVRNGIVTQVYVFVARKTLMPVSVAQTVKMPPSCAASPCLDHSFPANKFMGVSVLLNAESDLRNHWDKIFDAQCLSRFGGCDSYGELMPLAKELNLEAATKQLKTIR